MNLYRALYQIVGNGRLRRMTFAAPDAEQAHRVATDWELTDDRLLTVQALRPLTQQFTLGAA